ncbi:MAG: glycosyltransferase family 1 protein [Methylocystaceae bacterium]|nr:glycosyltransferase family 1 protein [Methylocystaceae bacterium]
MFDCSFKNPDCLHFPVNTSLIEDLMLERHKPHLCLIHPMDPRGSKLGGIETHIRNILKYYPDDFNLIFIGVDEIGDLPLGQITQVSYLNRSISFLPVLTIPTQRLNKAGRRLSESTTLLFTIALFKHYFLIQSLLKRTPVSIEIQRFEFSSFVRALGYRSIQWVHGEGAPDQKMDSLLKKFWFTHRINEYLAAQFSDYVFCVNQAAQTRLQSLFPHLQGKCEVMHVAVDTDVFSLHSFDLSDDVLKISFAGRLDEFKDPPLMFRVLAKLHKALEGKFEFHYVGDSSPDRFDEFRLIRSFTILHGLQTAQGVAQIARQCHCGILTSYFEGLPCYLLEMLATGRPVCAIRLPQYDQLITPGVSGYLVNRTQDPEICENELVDAFLTMWLQIKAQAIDPQRINQLIQEYSISGQMSRLFDKHRSRMIAH